jgi:GT2 family glycosyltransferase
MSDFFILIPVHNRRRTTLACITNLFRDSSIDPKCIVVIDDGSTDGTAESIRGTFSDVTILEGDGSLWWGGAMRLGMEWASKQPNFSGVVWLNDDCRPPPGLIRKLIDYSMQKNAIVSGQSFPVDGYVYGGHLKTMRGLKPVIINDDGHVLVDACNGNCVALPKETVQKLGPLSSGTFPQNFGDSDYTLRASAANIPVIVLGGPRYENDKNINISHARWSDRSIPAQQILRTILSPRSVLFPPARWAFFLRHWGVWGVILFCIPYFRMTSVLVSRLFLNRKAPVSNE